MLKYPELAMNRKREVTTVYKGERRVWCDREDAQSFFLEMMMSTDGEEYERAECIYTQCPLPDKIDTKKHTKVE